MRLGAELCVENVTQMQVHRNHVHGLHGAPCMNTAITSVRCGDEAAGSQCRPCCSEHDRNTGMNTVAV